MLLEIIVVSVVLFAVIVISILSLILLKTLYDLGVCDGKIEILKERLKNRRR